MKNNYKIAENKQIAHQVYKMTLLGDTSLIKNAGQFVNIKIPNYYLRRPISISNYDNKSITLIYKILGNGTKYLSTFKKGDNLDLLVGLGNGFDTNVKTYKPLIVGGGVGVPPLYRLTTELIKKGVNPIVVLGFNSKEDVFYKKEFENLENTKVYIATLDGTLGTKGNVIDVIKNINKTTNPDYLFTCGPIPMLKALSKLSVKGQFSFEERMGCGFGGCMGCTHKTKEGYKRICLEGPVLNKEEIIW